MGLIALLLMFPILPTDFKDGMAMILRVTGLTAGGKIDSAIDLALIYLYISVDWALKKKKVE
jgi:hypothetical protein